MKIIKKVLSFPLRVVATVLLVPAMLLVMLIGKIDGENLFDEIFSNL